MVDVFGGVLCSGWWFVVVFDLSTTPFLAVVFFQGILRVFSGVLGFWHVAICAFVLLVYTLVFVHAFVSLAKGSKGYVFPRKRKHLLAIFHGQARKKNLRHVL